MVPVDAGSGRTFYKRSKIFSSRRSQSDPVTRQMNGLLIPFRKWSVLAFGAECIAVILTFFVMVVLLKWKINQTMMYILLIIMAISAALLIITGRTAAEA